MYLDWNATAPPLADAIRAVASVDAAAWANPSSVHRLGRTARANLEAAREVVAHLLGAEREDLVFTSGGTEANNLALRQAAALVTSRLEHPSITRVAEALEQDRVPVRWLATAPDGLLDPDEVASALAGLPPRSVVAIAWANHETGVIQPVAEIARLAWNVGAKVHLDAVQAVGKLVGVPLAWADTVSVAAHKLGGPKGIGAIAWRSSDSLRPLLLGGAQERGLRPGTQGVGLAAGFACAARWVMDGGSERHRTIAPLRDRLEQALSRFGIANGANAPRMPHVTNLSFYDWRGDELVAALDLEGICAASGSACSAGTAEVSATIGAMLGRERAEAAVRFSLGESTTEAEVEGAIAVMGRVLARAGRESPVAASAG
ncbi:MAG: cysteine desulfurase [Polyangiaceae bacterium]|nr:cysteine desulfurase [Polyangiaceae bacterium]